MKIVLMQSEFNEYHFSELSAENQTLLQAASKQANAAYAPYSKFRVGAAVLLENGEIVGGSNQENASYPAGICAERTALSACASLHPNVAPVAIAIVVNDLEFQSESPTAPCGICRQTILEVENRYDKPMEIIFPSRDGLFVHCLGIKNLLPLSFGGKNLVNGAETND